MSDNLYTPLSTFLLGLIGIPIYICVAKRFKIIDTPNQRSSHKVPTPRGGGILIPAGIIGSCIYVFSALGHQPQALALSVTLTLVTLVGLIDDITSLPSKLRLTAHLACGGGLAWVTTPAYPAILLIFVTVAATVWLVGCLNIFNFLDGIDGIATCQGIVAALVWFVISHYSESTLASILSISALGGLFAFLLFNWPPAKVFMGDGCSGTLGFLFGAFPLLVASHELQDLWIHINYGALALFPFLFDGTYTLLRRLLRRENVLEAHRSHLYQRWNQSGKSHRFVTSAYSLWAILCGTVCLLTYFDIVPLWASWIISCLPAAALLIHSQRFAKD